MIQYILKQKKKSNPMKYKKCVWKKFLIQKKLLQKILLNMTVRKK